MPSFAQKICVGKSNFGSCTYKIKTCSNTLYMIFRTYVYQENGTIWAKTQSCLSIKLSIGSVESSADQTLSSVDRSLNSHNSSEIATFGALRLKT